jgi:hypothetical protein
MLTAHVATRWGTDMPRTCTRQEGQGSLFIAVDQGAAAGVGLQAATQGTRFAVLEPSRHGVRTAVGAFGHGGAQGLGLRHAHGRQARSHGLQEARIFVGIASAPAFVRAPAGNGGAARFLRTLQEPLLGLQTFETVEALRVARHACQRHDKETWLIGRHGEKAPAQGSDEQRCALADAASF